eukprot:754731-Hanusia_phi.AAC.1
MIVLRKLRISPSAVVSRVHTTFERKLSQSLQRGFSPTHCVSYELFDQVNASLPSNVRTSEWQNHSLNHLNFEALSKLREWIREQAGEPIDAMVCMQVQSQELGSTRHRLDELVSDVLHLRTFCWWIARAAFLRYNAGRWLVPDNAYASALPNMEINSFTSQTTPVLPAPKHALEVGTDLRGASLDQVQSLLQALSLVPESLSSLLFPMMWQERKTIELVVLRGPDAGGPARQRLLTLQPQARKSGLGLALGVHEETGLVCIAAEMESGLDCWDRAPILKELTTEPEPELGLDLLLPLGQG